MEAVWDSGSPVTRTFRSNGLRSHVVVILVLSLFFAIALAIVSRNLTLPRPFLFILSLLLVEGVMLTALLVEVVIESAIERSRTRRQLRPAPADRAETGETDEMRRDLDRFPSPSVLEQVEMRPDLERVADPSVPESTRGEPAVAWPAARSGSSGGSKSLADVLRRLEVFDSELTHMRQLVDRTDGSYSTLIQRWHPLSEDPSVRTGNEKEPADDGPGKS